MKIAASAALFIIMVLMTLPGIKRQKDKRLLTVYRVLGVVAFALMIIWAREIEILCSTIISTSGFCC